jgi:[ribosomal protein S5]-alanine N-acetyltransferase
MINSQRLTIRPLLAQDAEFIIELLNEPDFHRYIADKNVRNIEEALHYIVSGPQKCFEQHGFALMLVSLHEGTKLGVCGLLKRDELAHPDLGFAFLAKFYRQGYAFEAAQAVLAYHQLTPILAITDLDNMPSQNLLAKLGFQFVTDRAATEHAKASRLFELV